MRNFFEYSLMISLVSGRKGTRPGAGTGPSDYKITENMEDDPFFRAFRRIWMPEDLDWIPEMYLPMLGYFFLVILSFYVGELRRRYNKSLSFRAYNL